MADDIDRLMKRIRGDNIKFVRFEIPCITGQAIGMLVPARNCEHFLRDGFPFFAPATMQTINTAMPLNEFNKTGFRNVPVFPDIDSYKIISWKPLVPTASIMVSQPIKYDTLYATDSRTIAIRQLNILNSNPINLDFYSSIEHEFCLLKETEIEDKGKKRTALKPITNPGCYHLERISKFTDFFNKIDDNLRAMGVECDRLHSEVASGQFEITALPEYNIKAADSAYWIKCGLREMAMQYNEWIASFMTHIGDTGDFDVVEDDAGAHFNFSLWFKDSKDSDECKDNVENGNKNQKHRVNACWNFEKNELSDTALYFLGGMLNHIRGMTAFCCPSVICYKTRFNSPWVSSHGNWGQYNRTALIRVKPNKNGKNTHFEFRLPSSLANPYLVLASAVCAGIDGIKNQTMPPKETTIDMIDEKERAKCYSFALPKTLGEALVALENDKVLSDNLGSYFVKCYIATKRLEIKEMATFKQKNMRPVCYSLL